MFLFNTANKKYIELFSGKIYFESANLTNKGFLINNINAFGARIEKITIGLSKLELYKLNILKFDFNFNAYYKDAFHFNGDLLNKKISFESTVHNGKITLNTKGIEKSKLIGFYTNGNIILELSNGILAYSGDKLIAKSDTKKYFLQTEIDLKNKEIKKVDFYFKDRKIKLLFDEKWDFKSSDENLNIAINLNKDLIGSGKININKKFGILDSDLNFNIEAKNMSVHAYGNKNQSIKIQDFDLLEKNIKWNLYFNAKKQAFELDSDSIKLHAQFLTNNIKFNFKLNSKKIDISAFGFMDYDNNITIEGNGDYISLLDMKSLFKSSGKNTLNGKFKWKKAQWISDLYLQDMKISCYKSAEGLEKCSIDANFEENPIVLWKNMLHDPLYFKVWNFARAFELMYGDNMFKSTGVLDGEIYVGEKGMPWHFTLHDFESTQQFSAIYLQVISLKFWASLFKQNQKKWDYLSGSGYISNDKYEINEIKMENDYFKIDGSGFIHRYEDLLDINGFLGTKSITSDLKDLMKSKGKSKVDFHIHGSLKNPIIDNKIGFRKLAAPMLPLAFFLI
ncbi:hypothetical protein FZC35_00720 [Candidatus Cytomitobacter indipagum]|uniref:Uncharacterized protein n=1 Tax=Candidatus Cytomitobacter indipagum TaxID=2601575 RepID=A0A5C0UDS8_9PROT|nr:hypothetical protein [Candidatus Cytomitobacter indipagum]QEK37909.1 hypothetical protein FZC35_00720 [Candidatus Cytomitobacter indipagum]